MLRFELFKQLEMHHTHFYSLIFTRGRAGGVGGVTSVQLLPTTDNQQKSWFHWTRHMLDSILMQQSKQ